jgi:hypothetical protein
MARHCKGHEGEISLSLGHGTQEKLYDGLGFYTR